MTGVWIAALLIGAPALAWTLWPLLGRGGATAFLALPRDAREPLREDKRAVMQALRELAFEHDAGHISDEDYAELRSRYERDAAAILAELDRLAEPPAAGPPARAAAAGTRSPWRHPAAVATAALALVAFGVALGAGVVRFTEPDPTAGAPPTGSRPLAPPLAATPPTGSGGSPRTVTPDVLQGMLQAARASLFAGRYSEAIAAYQAVLKRDPRNVDALTHLGLIVAIGGHAESALETFDRALAIDPNYPPALLYRGQILYENKHDIAGAIHSWEKFVAVAPAGEDRERVVRMIAEARERSGRPAQ